MSAHKLLTRNEHFMFSYDLMLYIRAYERLTTHLLNKELVRTLPYARFEAPD